MDVKLTHTEKAALDQTICVFLLRGYSPDGDRQFAYIAMNGLKVGDFRKAMSKKGVEVDIEKFGSIIESGLGDPSPELMQRMEKEYGVNHKDMLSVPLDGGH